MSMDEFIKTLSPEQKEALLNALQKTNNDTREVQENNIQSDFTVNSTRNSNNRRKEQVKARKNEWIDTGEFRDVETKYGERTPRNRKPSKKIDVECSICGRSFKTDPKYVYGEYHRCSRCTGR